MGHRRLRWLLGIVGVSLLCLHSVQSAPEERYLQFFEVFADALEHAKSSHVDPPEEKVLLEGALRGVAKRLDRYSDYIAPAELNRFRDEMRQEFGGIGIQIGIVNDELRVSTPLRNTPAFRAGVQSGDRIVEIEGTPTAELLKGSPREKMEQAVSKLKGRPGTDVRFTVVHEGSEEPITVTVTRAIIHVDSVKGDAYMPTGDWDFFIDKEQKIAYVRIEQFHDNTAEELERILQSLREQGMKGMVLDLRFNPGGLLTTAVKTCDLFVSEGVIVSTQARNAAPVVYEAHRPRTFEGFPVAVLINQRSASASEIVAACLQDHQRATLIGERTWGKGSVQNIIDLGDGRGAMKLTTASYHRPSGKNIHRFDDAKESDVWGVSPNDGLEVTLSDPQRLAGKGKAEARRLELQAMGEWYADRMRRDVMPRPGQSTPGAATEDRQLKRALEHLRGELQKQPAT